VCSDAALEDAELEKAVRLAAEVVDREASALRDAGQAERTARSIAAADGEALAVALADARAHESADAQLLRIRADAVAELKVLDASLLAARKTIAEAAPMVADLTCVDRVLGPRGVRGALLEGALAALERLANAWLSRLGRDGLRLRVTPYREKRSGGLIESLSLEVDGAGGGHGYKAASGGERRRIDLAITAALSGVAEQVAGWAGSTLWFDEAFDALDDDGLEAVELLVHELARDRCVVVVTHSAHLRARFVGARRYTVSGGVLAPVGTP
jgi:DNA repair exonuclease SbcCD ATPase subunit